MASTSGGTEDEEAEQRVETWLDQLLRWVIDRVQRAILAVLPGALDAFRELQRRSESPTDTARRVIEEVEPTAEAGSPTSASEASSAAPDAAPDPQSVEVAGQLLDRMRLEASSRRESIEKDVARNRMSQRTVFRARIIAGVVTFVLAAVGVVLILSGHVTVGIVSAAVAILPGSGVAILNRLASELDVKEQRLNRIQDDYSRILDAIESAMSLNSPAREREMVVLASGLRERALKGSA